MKIALRKYLLGLGIVGLASQANASGAAAGCASLAKSLNDLASHERGAIERVGKAAPAFDASKTKVYELPEEIVQRLVRERIDGNILGGSSDHPTFLNLEGGLSGSKTTKLYFSGKGPQTIEELSLLIARSSAPSIEQIIRATPGDTRHVLLTLPIPGDMIKNGHEVALSENFGSLKGKVITSLDIRAAFKKLAAERGEPELARVQPILKNDMHTVLMKMVGDLKLPKGSALKAEFGGTGFGEGNALMLENGVFKSMTTESGHLPLASFPGIEKKLPDGFVEAARVARFPRLMPRPSPLDSENLVAGGRPRENLGGAYSVLLSHYLPNEKVPAWIRQATVPDAKRVVKAASHPGDLELLNTLQAKTYVTLEDVTKAANEGGEVARRMMKDGARTQGFLAALTAVHFGKTPSGRVLPPEFVFGENYRTAGRLVVAVRKGGCFTGWESYMADVEKGFQQGLHYQFHENPTYQKQLREAGIRADENSVTLLYDTGTPSAADPDFQGFVHATRANQLEGVDPHYK